MQAGPRRSGILSADERAEAIMKVAQRIVDAVCPTKVILFGSYARGEAHRRSDVDLLVVIRDGGEKRAAQDSARKAARGEGLPCDISVTTDDEVRRLGDLVGTVIRPSLRQGRLLYDASAPQKWDIARPAREVEVEPVSEADRLRWTREWIENAGLDLELAERGLVAPPVEGLVCYHAQQAAEKALKAVLVFLQVEYPLAHNLDEVREAIPPGWALAQEYPDLKWLSEWVIQGRYPGDWPHATEADARQALTQARAILDSVLRDLAEHGFARPPQP